MNRHARITVPALIVLPLLMSGCFSEKTVSGDKFRRIVAKDAQRPSPHFWTYLGSTPKHHVFDQQTPTILYGWRTRFFVPTDELRIKPDSTTPFDAESPRRIGVFCPPDAFCTPSIKYGPNQEEWLLD